MKLLQFNPCKSSIKNQRMLQRLCIKWDYEFGGNKNGS